MTLSFVRNNNEGRLIPINAQEYAGITTTYVESTPGVGSKPWRSSSLFIEDLPARAKQWIRTS